MRQRAVDVVELMDLPGCDSGRLEQTYRQFPVVNRALSGWRTLYKRELRPFLAHQAASLLDIGCGGGDIPVLLSRWAARDGLTLRVTGIDPDPRAAAFARRRPVEAGLEFRQAHSTDLVREGRRFDFVISNHVLHHLSGNDLQQLLADSLALGTEAVLHSDLRRSPAAFGLFFVAALPFRGSYIRADGLTSIRRSYTPRELSAVVPSGWTVEPAAAFHQVLAHRRYPYGC